MKPNSPRELPIIFTAESVRAILENRKTQTRRTMNTQPSGRFALAFDDESGEWHEDGGTWRCKTRFRVGDVLWVKEAWRTEELEDMDEVEEDSELQPGTDGIRFRADNSFRPIYNTQEASEAWGKAHRRGDAWRSTLYMPRWASRISLEVTEVRAQRVQDISEEDAIAEGVHEMICNLDGRAFDNAQDKWCRYTKRLDPGARIATARGAFAYIWDRINGRKSPWLRNDFVFAYTFRRIEK